MTFIWSILRHSSRRATSFSKEANWVHLILKNLSHFLKDFKGTVLKKSILRHGLRRTTSFQKGGKLGASDYKKSLSF